jgi:hypothetical protein
LAQSLEVRHATQSERLGSQTVAFGAMQSLSVTHWTQEPLLTSQTLAA